MTPRKKKVPETPQVILSGRLVRETRSGSAYLREITDEEALAMIGGEELIVHEPTGLCLWTVDSVKMGAAGESGELFDVPVLVGHLNGKAPMARAVPDCYLFDLI